MNLSQTFETLEIALKEITQLEFNKIGGTSEFLISDALLAKSAYLTIFETGLFDRFEIIYSQTSISTAAKSVLKIDTNQYNQINSLYNDLRLAIIAILELKRVYNISTSTDGIAIKLTKADNFEELADISNALNKALAQPIINSEINGEVKIESVDNGSIWFYVFLGSTAAVTLIARIVFLALEFAKKKNELQIQEQSLKSLNLKNELLEDLYKAHKNLLEKFQEDECRKIETEYYKENNIELFGKLKMSVDLFSDLLNKGVEVHPSLSSPKEVADQFPKASDFKSLLSLTSAATKKLMPNEGGEVTPH